MQAIGLGDRSTPSTPAEQGGDFGAGIASFGHRDGCLPTRARSRAGCGASWPLFLDAKGRFLALELTSLCHMFPSEVFPGAVQVLRLLPRAAGCGDLQPQHMALLQERTKPCHPGRVLLPFLSLCVSTS